MSDLHLVRLGLNLRALAAFAIAEGVDDDDRGYAVHLALRRRFGAAAPQPFHLFEEASAGPHLLGYATDAAALDDMAGLPTPDLRLDGIFPDAPSARPMPGQWRAGARYAFEVRVRPVIRYGRDRRTVRGAAGLPGGGERDAFLVAIEKSGDAPVDRESVYRAWLLDRFAGAADIERSDLRRLRRLRVRRSSHSKAGPGKAGHLRIEGYEALFTGVLTVADGAAFAHLLAHGVGRHTAFGFGMLLLAPPGPRDGAG